MTDISNIPGSENFVKTEFINKGFSEDEKYYIETSSGEKLLLRVSDISELERKKGEYDMLKRAASVGVLTNIPVDFGLCNDGKNIYQLLQWLDGKDIKSVLPDLNENEHYIVGIKSGELLKKIHSLPAPENIEPWGIRFQDKIKHCMDVYNANDFKSPHVGPIIKYLHENADILDSRPQTFIHGDFWVANLILNPSGEVGIIDFNFYNLNYGDPWFELGYTMPWEGEVFYSYYFTALFKGRFGGDPPFEFFKILKYYYAFQALAAICDITENKGEKREEAIKSFENVVRCFGDFKNDMPNWYLQNIHVQYINNIPIRLKKLFDFEFLNQYGEVFTVIGGENASGNLCFGIEDKNNGKKYFLKFAGAPKEKFEYLTTGETVRFLKEAKQIYQDLAHENLIKLVKSEEVGGGYSNIFEWVDAECIGYPSPPSRQKFLNLPLEAKLRAFEDILNFHAHVAERGYVAIDFYADQILYDFENGKTIICDIDFYQKSPYYGDMGLWGSSNFVSPEELVPGSRVDEITMVYTMGATAFSIFSDYDRSVEKWPLSKPLYDIVNKAVSDNRDLRQQSIRELIQEWKANI